MSPSRTPTSHTMFYPPSPLLRVTPPPNTQHPCDDRRAETPAGPPGNDRVAVEEAAPIARPPAKGARRRGRGRIQAAGTRRRPVVVEGAGPAAPHARCPAARIGAAGARL